MSPRTPAIRLLPTGVPDLDKVLGGGLPEYSFNLIAGGPGCGKTTLAQQILFSQATETRPALYFTVLGEPPLKMLRHARQYAFFDERKVDHSVRFLNLGVEAMEQDLGKLLDRIRQEVESFHPALVAVDSFGTVSRATCSEGHLQAFVQRLALFLTSWQATTFLIGEYDASESHSNPLFTVADGIVWLSQTLESKASIRHLQISKLRGAAPLPGLHTFIISSEGMRVFPRDLAPAESPRLSVGTRAPTGVAGLDAMLNGGIPHGECALVSGPTGSGKSLLVRHFMARGAQSNERGLLVSFETEPGEYLEPTHPACGPRLREFLERGMLSVLHLSALDLSLEEVLWRIGEAVRRTRACRLAVDSLAGFALSLAPSFREDLGQSLLRLIKGLGGLGVTTLVTDDVPGRRAGLQRPKQSQSVTELLMDVVISQRYVDTGGNVERTMAVLKMKNSSHQTVSRRYVIGEAGMVVGGRVTRVARPGSSGRGANATRRRARGKR